MDSTTSNECGIPLFDEWPYAYVLYESKAASYCHFCLKSKWIDQAKLQRCSRCKFAHYCDRKCQISAHRDHKEECKCLERCEGFIPSRKARIIARIIFKKEDKYEPDLHLPKELQERRFSELMNHQENITKDKRRSEELRIISDQLDKYLLPEHWVSDGELLDIYGKVTINSFAIWVRDVPIALGLYVGISILDHSCDPDVFAAYDGPRIIIRPFKADIGRKSPNQLRIGYFSTFVTTQERQSCSSSRYYFECDCDHCKDKLRDAEMRSVKCEHCSGIAVFGENDPNDFTTTCQSCTITTDGTAANALMNELEMVLGRLGSNPDAVKEWHNLKSPPEELANLDRRARALLSDINIYSSSLSVKLQGMCNVAKLSAEAFEHCLRALKGVQHFLHPNHPLRLMQTKSAGIVLVENPSTTEEGIRLLIEAEKGYKFVGDNNRAQECRSVINGVRKEMKTNGSA